MEKTKCLFYRALETVRLLLPKRYLQRWVFPAAAAMLLACGLREFSMSPIHILRIKRRLAQLTVRPDNVE